MVVISVIAPAPSSFTDGGDGPEAENRLAETPLPVPKPRALERSRLSAALKIGVVTVVLAPLTKFVEVAGRLAQSRQQRKRAQALAAAEKADAEERAQAVGRLLSGVHS